MSENIAKKFFGGGGGYFLTHTVHKCSIQHDMHEISNRIYRLNFNTIFGS